MKQITEIPCVCCSNGCILTVDESAAFAVSGNRCDQGPKYALSQLNCPTRTVEASMKIEGANEPRCEVKTSCPIPKEKVMEVVEYLETITLTAPVWMNQVLIQNVCGTEANIISCRSM